MPDHCLRCNAELANEANYCARCGAFVSPPAPADARDALIGTVVLGRYRVVRLLGEGGMGKVYLAQQSMGQATRPVALKTLRRELTGDPKVSGRFMRESAIVIRLAHPNTIQFYDFGQLDDGTMVIVMEYIEGQTLADELRAGPLPLARVDALFAQICGSLAEAHAHGIVHRDLKPQNVLLTTRAGRNDFVKVVDFGIAVHRSEDDQDPTRLTTHGTLVGTPPYMSPEQFQDRDVDARSDVYSLGIMLYRMLTGELPFEAKNTWQWAAAHIDQVPKPITEHAATAALPKERADAVMRALAKNPGDRPRDAADLLREFTGIVAPVVTAPSSSASEPPPGLRDAHPSAAAAAATASTLHAEAARPRAHGAWLSWLPVALLVAAGVVVTWRTAGVGLLSTDEGAQGAPSQRERQSAGKARRPPQERRRSAATTPNAQGGRSAPLAAPDAALATLRGALEGGELAPAMSAFANAQRSLGADHAELRRLKPRLSELGVNTLRGLSDRGECKHLEELSARLAAAGIGDSAEITRAVQGCQAAPNSSVDASHNSGEAK